MIAKTIANMLEICWNICAFDSSQASSCLQLIWSSSDISDVAMMVLHDRCFSWRWRSRPYGVEFSIDSLLMSSMTSESLTWTLRFCANRVKFLPGVQRTLGIRRGDVFSGKWTFPADQRTTCANPLTKRDRKLKLDFRNRVLIGSHLLSKCFSSSDK